METTTGSSGNGDRGSPPYRRGLANVGNTCGLNALLQCIAHTDQLRDFFLLASCVDQVRDAEGMTDGKGGRQFSIVKELKLLLRQLWLDKAEGEEEGAEVGIIPRRFARSFEEATRGRIDYGDQMDMSEVWMVLLDAFERELQQVPKLERDMVLQDVPWGSLLNASAIADTGFLKMADQAKSTWTKFLEKLPAAWASLVNGIQVGQIVCGNEKCKHVHHNFEPFSCISIDIPEREPGATNHAVHLGECFAQYFRAEMMSEWVCDKCKVASGSVNNAAEKLTRFWWAPKVLVVALKRFRQRPDGRLSKSHVPIDIPPSFDFLPGTELARWNSRVDAGKYELRAIGCHFGSLHGGHYTALAQEHGKWYHFDDMRISAVSAEQILKNNSHAYMLFYERAIA